MNNYKRKRLFVKVFNYLFSRNALLKMGICFTIFVFLISMQTTTYAIDWKGIAEQNQLAYEAMEAYDRWWSTLTQRQKDIVQEVENIDMMVYLQAGSVTPASDEYLETYYKVTGAKTEEEKSLIYDRVKLFYTADRNITGDSIVTKFNVAEVSPRKRDIIVAVTDIELLYKDKYGTGIPCTTETVNKICKKLGIVEDEAFAVVLEVRKGKVNYGEPSTDPVDESLLDNILNELDTTRYLYLQNEKAPTRKGLLSPSTPEKTESPKVNVTQAAVQGLNQNQEQSKATKITAPASTAKTVSAPKTNNTPVSASSQGPSFSEIGIIFLVLIIIGLVAFILYEKFRKRDTK